MDNNDFSRIENTLQKSLRQAQRKNVGWEWNFNFLFQFLCVYEKIR